MADKEEEKKAAETAGKKASKKKAAKKKASKKKTAPKTAKKKAAKKKVTKKAAAKKTTKKKVTPAKEAAPVDIPEDPILVDPEEVEPILAEAAEKSAAEAAGEVTEKDAVTDEATKKLEEMGVIASDQGEQEEASESATTAGAEHEQIKGADMLFRGLYAILIVGAVMLYLLAVYGPAPDKPASPVSQPDPAVTAAEAVVPGQALDTGTTAPAEEPVVQDEKGVETSEPEAGDGQADEKPGLRPLPADQQQMIEKVFSGN